MSEYLCVVSETFYIKGRGLIVSLPAQAKLLVGMPLLLKRPDGSTLSAPVAGIALVSPVLVEQVDVLLRDLSKDDVPVGTEVWLVDDLPH